MLAMAASLILTIPFVPARADEPDPKEIRRLIGQLGSLRYKDREIASQRLEAIGGPAWYLLAKTAAGSADLETRRRAERLAKAIGKRLFVEVRHFGGQGGYWLNRVAFSRDGRQAVATGGAVIFYDLKTGKEVNRVLELSFARPGLALSRDGRYFLTGHVHDAVVRLGEMKSGKEIRTFRGHTAGLRSVALSADGGRAVSGSIDGTVRLWDVKTGQERQTLRAAGAVISVAFSPDGSHILSGHSGAGKDHPIRLWEAESGREIRRFSDHTNEVTGLAFLPDGRSFVSASMDGTLRLWDGQSGKELRRMQHPGGAYDVAISPDGRRALSAGFGDRKMRLWDLTDGFQLHVFEGHQGAVLGVAISADGRQALSCDSLYTVRLWRLPEPEQLKEPVRPK
jgi:WD40 repeat protein